MAIEDVVGQPAAPQAADDDKSLLFGIFIGVVVTMIALVIAFVYQVHFRMCC